MVKGGMSVDLETLKKFLRIDYDDEDDLLKMILDAAKLWVKSAVGRCDETDARVRLLLVNACSTMYENRTYTTENIEDKIRYFNHAILLQLEVETYADESESGGTE